MNASRGNETKAHLKAKESLVRRYNNAEWLAFPEGRNADVVAMHLDTRFPAALEVETTPKHVINNITKDFANGFKAVAVISLTPHFHNQIRNKIQRCFPDSRDRIRMFPYDRQGLSDLNYWLNRRAATMAGEEF